MSDRGHRRGGPAMIALMFAFEVAQPVLDAAPSRAGGLRFRAAELADARLYAELSLQHRPDEPADPQVALYRWANPTPGFNRERFIVEHSGRPVGFARHMEADAELDSERNGHVEAFLTPAWSSRDRLTAMFEFLHERARSAGVRIFNAGIDEDDLLTATVLEAMGYQRDRVARAWELDLVENAERLLGLAARADGGMRSRGIRCHALADDPDPNAFEAYYEAWAEAVEDVPHTAPFHRPDLAEFKRWMESPDCSPQWVFVAREGDRLVGMSSLLFPPTRGNVWTGFTGVVRDRRGQGIGRAVKLAILKQAIQHRVACVRTDNDSTNAPMLHINEELGYQRIPGLVSFRLS